MAEQIPDRAHSAVRRQVLDDGEGGSTPADICLHVGVALTACADGCGFVPATPSSVVVEEEPNRLSVPPFELEEMTVDDLQVGMASGQRSATEITEMYLERIAATDRQGPTLQSIIETNPDATQIARDLDAERAAGGVRGPLHGNPILIKDNIDTNDPFARYGWSDDPYGTRGRDSAARAHRCDQRDPATNVGAATSYADYTQFLQDDGLRGARLGIIRSYFGFHERVDHVMEDAVQAMRDSGADIVDEVELPTHQGPGNPGLMGITSAAAVPVQLRSPAVQTSRYHRALSRVSRSDCRFFGGDGVSLRFFGWPTGSNRRHGSDAHRASAGVTTSRCCRRSSAPRALRGHVCPATLRDGDAYTDYRSHSRVSG